MPLEIRKRAAAEFKRVFAIVFGAEFSCYERPYEVRPYGSLMVSGVAFQPCAFISSDVFGVGRRKRAQPERRVKIFFNR